MAEVAVVSVVETEGVSVVDAVETEGVFVVDVVETEGVSVVVEAAVTEVDSVEAEVHSHDAYIMSRRMD